MQTAIATRLISYEINLTGRAWVYHSYMATRAQAAIACRSLRMLAKRGKVRALAVKQLP